MTTYFKHTPEQAREALAAALESGRFKQGCGQLRASLEERGEMVLDHCCLGVACQLFLEMEGRGQWDDRQGDSHYFNLEPGRDPWTAPLGASGWATWASSVALPGLVREWLGLHDDSGSFVEGYELALPVEEGEGGRATSLMGMNDGGLPFPEIAKVIREGRVRLAGWLSPDEARAKFGELMHVRDGVGAYREFQHSDEGGTWRPEFTDFAGLSGYRFHKAG